MVSKKLFGQADWEAFQLALNDDGKITPEERQVLLKKNIPDFLMAALSDGVIDEKEMATLIGMGISPDLIQALQDGYLTDEELEQFRIRVDQEMKNFRTEQLMDIFTKLNHRRSG